MKPCTERIYNGVIKENPTLVLMLGMCPTLAVTTSCMNGFGMGVSTLVVLVMSNLVISALRKVIPDAVRLPAYIVIVASLVTVVELLMEAYVPDIYDALGIYIPLIVVNCIFWAVRRLMPPKIRLFCPPWTDLAWVSDLQFPLLSSDLSVSFWVQVPYSACR